MCSLFNSIVYLTLDTFRKVGRETENILLAWEQDKTYFHGKLKLISI